MTKFFIKKDFLGFPLAIVHGIYENDILIQGEHFLPRVFRKSKVVSFDSLEEMKDYKICNCGTDCEYNKEFKRIYENRQLF